MIVAGKKALGGEKLQTSLPNNIPNANYLPNNQIYIDSCFTYISLLKHELLEDIYHIDTMILCHTNAGTSKTNWVGKYDGVEARIDVSGIANIFSMPSIMKIGYHIAYDSDDG